MKSRIEKLSEKKILAKGFDGEKSSCNHDKKGDCSHSVHVKI